MNKGEQKDIVLIVVWFGMLPFWMPAFLLSCRYNPDIDWIIYCDTEPPAIVPQNVSFRKLTLQQFNQLTSEKLEINVKIDKSYAYKVCDFKIIFGDLFPDDIRDYKFWGCCDLDIVWGNIRKFIDEHVLVNYDIITTRVNRISGHFCLFRNSDIWTSLYKRIPGIFEKLSDNETCMRVDEHLLTDLLVKTKTGFFRKLIMEYLTENQIPRIYWEQHLTTNGKYQRKMLDLDNSYELRWEKGLTYGYNDEEFMYLHFHKIRKHMKYIDFGFEANPEFMKITKEGIFTL